MEILAFMPAGAIKNHNNIITGVTAGNLVDENLQVIAIDGATPVYRRLHREDLTAL
ncbi:hypothetical protein R2Q26_12270 [Nitrosomonas sp. Is37]|nr:hypothetical protein [Nitrosomonas sp. Is37]MDV6345313.1 hypothetical protein [Nitrosomonas sp. Is37]